jgi:glycosyltransferase involved in cell wall biosynthesis
MKDVLMIAHFCGDIGNSGNNRFNYLAELFAGAGVSVELVTSNFNHNRKVRRDESVKHPRYAVKFISEPGYLKNVSLKRIFSYYVMGRNLEKYLETRKKPDVIYCSVPSLDVAKAAVKYAKKNNIRILIDIQDLWPETFKMIFHIPVVSDILFYPMHKQAEYIYAEADEIVAVSKTYADKAAELRPSRKTHVVFIGTELESFDRAAEENRQISKPEGELWVAYIGTLSHSYDLINVIDALDMIKENGVGNVKFVVMGDGPLRNEFEEHANGKGIYSEFMGNLPYEKMAGILESCDIAVNPIKHGSAGSIINKHADYAAAGLPVVNTQESIEYRNLLEEYDAGLNCENGNPADVAEKLQRLCSDKELRETMGENSRRLAREKFDRKATYPEIVELLLEV